MNDTSDCPETESVKPSENTVSGPNKTKAFLPPDLEPLRLKNVWGIVLRAIEQKKGCNKYIPFTNHKTGKTCRQHTPDTLFNYDMAVHISRNYTSSNHKPVVYLSLRLASEALDKNVYVVDLDKEKSKFKEPPQEYLKNTLINKSPSGVGVHCFLFCDKGNELPAKLFDASSAVDLQTPEKIVTMTEDWVNK
jgi:hypothetical protein